MTSEPVHQRKKREKSNLFRMILTTAMDLVQSSPPGFFLKFMRTSRCKVTAVTGRNVKIACTAMITRQMVSQLDLKCWASVILGFGFVKPLSCEHASEYPSR
jgi:hypothetical protein